jgi:hypothetical protein
MRRELPPPSISPASKRTFQAVLCILFIACAPALWPQTAGNRQSESPEAGRQGLSPDLSDPAAFIGLTLEALINRLGAPQAVYAARGFEDWQDDVVFVYPGGDFYVFRDRVWQLSLQSAYGIRVGDPRAAAELALGDGAEGFEDHILLSLPGKSWPLVLRVNLGAGGTGGANGTDSAPRKGGGVSSLFVYRPDF